MIHWDYLLVLVVVVVIGYYCFVIKPHQTKLETELFDVLAASCINDVTTTDTLATAHTLGKGSTCNITGDFSKSVIHLLPIDAKHKVITKNIVSIKYGSISSPVSAHKITKINVAYTSTTVTVTIKSKDSKPVTHAFEFSGTLGIYNYVEPGTTNLVKIKKE